METTTSVHLDPDAAKIAAGLRRVIVLTDVDDDRLAHARRAATRIAAEHGWELILYDRSHERWTDTPHPSGPVGRDELDAEEWEHLIQQMSDIEAAGVTVSAWLATVPSITAMIDALQQLEIDGVLLPDDLDKPKLMDRLIDGSDPVETVERVADLQLPDITPAFLVVDEQGAVTLSTHDWS